MLSGALAEIGGCGGGEFPSTGNKPEIFAIAPGKIGDFQMNTKVW